MLKFIYLKLNIIGLLVVYKIAFKNKLYRPYHSCLKITFSKLLYDTII